MMVDPLTTDSEEVSVRIGGAAGDGVASTGEILAKTFSRSGLHCFGLNSYQSAIRGGHVWFGVRAGERKFYSQGDSLDILIALNAESVEIHGPVISHGGIAIFDKTKVKGVEGSIPSYAKALPMPLIELARKYEKNPIMQNTVALGAVMELLGLDFDVFESVLRDMFGVKKPQVVEANVQAARSGGEFVKSMSIPFKRALKTSNKRRMLISGNQAIALGAVAAGCKFYAAYPMTPASSILHWMAAHAPEYGIVVKQAEDELAVINMGIGAAHAGVRAMVGTSGGGFSLMVEALGQAGMTETPIVIIEAQRAGPSTGLPTKTEQGDLNMLLGSSQGDFPRIVLAPSTVEEAFYTTAHAFNLAERYQCPVIVASDLLLSEHIETVDELDTNVPIDRGLIAHLEPGESFRRYKVTESGVSPRAFPGQEGLMFVAATDEHDETGAVISDVLAGLPVYTKVRERIMEKRMRKLDVARKEMKPPTQVGDDSADLTFVCWGSTFGAVSDALVYLRGRGRKVNALVFRDLWPFPQAESEAMLKSAKNLVLVENNFTGQLGKLIRGETGINIVNRLLKYDGEPFYPSEIIQKADEVLK